MIHTKAVLVISGFWLLLPLLVNAEVTVSINNTPFTYAKNPRMTEVLAPVALTENWYWPNSKLFRTNGTQAIQSQQKIVDMLKSNVSLHDEHSQAYQNIAQQISNWKILDRVLLKIDFDLARTSSSNNPLFENDDYRLLLSVRPTSIYVFGAIEEALVLPYANNKCVHDMIANLRLSSIADNSHVYVISPEGNIVKTSTAYWNNQCNVVKPGSVIFIPIQEDILRKNYQYMNVKIAELSVNRAQMQ